MTTFGQMTRNGHFFGQLAEVEGGARRWTVITTERRCGGGRNRDPLCRARELPAEQSGVGLIAVRSEGRVAMYVSLPARPTYKAITNSVTTFMEIPAAKPGRLRPHCYSGSSWCDEFIYRSARAAQLAKPCYSPIRASIQSRGEVAERIKPTDEHRMMKLRRTGKMALKPSGEEGRFAAVITAETAEIR